MKNPFIFIVVLLMCFSSATAEEGRGDLFLELLSAANSSNEQERIVKRIAQKWRAEDANMAIELLNLTGAPSLRALLEQKTEQSFNDSDDWYFWLWNENLPPPADYADFKAKLYKRIDPHFETYFIGRQDTAQINLNEIRWGGVLQDGIPPLRSPKMISAENADYLEDDNIIFGVEINGDARAYPKRILAWHEMFVDNIGGLNLAGVYCTLCGAVILFETDFNGASHRIGTSGFLYRSNKLMYDMATQSLWSTFKGEPVLGPLADKGIALKRHSVVTTTWGEWMTRHPQTQVLSLDTGHRRDYDEGAAYREYFATDRLMFNVPFVDKRLSNKDEILALRFPAHPKEQLAIDVKFLAANPVYHDRIGAQKFVVLTDDSGANRVYDSADIKFIDYDQQNIVTDENGDKWRLEESRLISTEGRKLARLPYHRAFWFGWHAVFPQSRLITLDG